MEEVFASAVSHPYGLDIQNFSVPQDLFSEPVREEGTQQRRLYMVIYRQKKASILPSKRQNTAVGRSTAQGK